MELYSDAAAAVVAADVDDDDDGCGAVVRVCRSDSSSRGAITSGAVPVACLWLVYAMREVGRSTVPRHSVGTGPRRVARILPSPQQNTTCRTHKRTTPVPVSYSMYIHTYYEYMHK